MMIPQVIKLVPILRRLDAEVEAKAVVQAKARIGTGKTVGEQEAQMRDLNETLRGQEAQIRGLNRGISRLHWLMWLVLAVLVAVLVIQVPSW